jgi:hypothetical protein
MTITDSVCTYNDDVLRFKGNSAFTDVGGIIMKDFLATTRCQEQDTGLSDPLSNVTNPLANGSPVNFTVHHPTDYSTLIHESGHATFGLREEYYLPFAAREDFSRHSNVFNSQEHCIQRSVKPDKCQAVYGTNDTLWKSDYKSDEGVFDAMSGGNGASSVWYGPDCVQRAQCLIDDDGC